MPDQQKIADIVSSAPDWLRRDLVSNDRSKRSAAEEVLATMIASALAKSEEQA